MLTGSEVRHILKQQGVKVGQVLDLLSKLKTLAAAQTPTAYVERVLQSFFSGL